MLLENEIIKLRAVEPEDLDIIYEWENNSAVWRLSNTLVPFSRFVIKQYLENSHLSIYETSQLRLMIVSKQKYEAIGTVDLFDFDAFNQRAGVGILINEPKNRRKGFAETALNLLIEYSFVHLSLHQLYCNISEGNEASLNLFRKVGFEICGKRKEWLKTDNSHLDEYNLQLINTSSLSG